MTIYDVQCGGVETDVISLIGDDENPANGLTMENGGFVALSKLKDSDKPTLIKFKNDRPELKMVYGVVLRADQLIDRVIDGEFCQIKFSAETIRQAALDWTIAKSTEKSNWNHEGGSNNEIEFLGHEVWIVEDGENDKANAIGMKVEKGDWVVGQKLSDSDWEEYIKSGRVKGYSMESFLKFSSLKFNKVNIDTNEKNVIGDDSLNKNKKTKMSVRTLLNLFSSKQVSTKRVINLASIEVDGVEFISDDDFAVETLVYTIGEDETKVPVAEKTFEVDGFTIVTDADGMITSREAVDSEDSADDSTENADDSTITMKKQKQTLSDGIGAFIELPVGEWTIGDTIYTVEEVVIPAEESWDGEEYKCNNIVKMLPVAENQAAEELEKVKEELKKVKEQFSAREIELGALEAKNAVSVDLKSMTALERFRYFKNN